MGLQILFEFAGKCLNLRLNWILFELDCLNWILFELDCLNWILFDFKCLNWILFELDCLNLVKNGQKCMNFVQFKQNFHEFTLCKQISVTSFLPTGPSSISCNFIFTAFFIDPINSLIVYIYIQLL